MQEDKGPRLGVVTVKVMLFIGWLVAWTLAWLWLCSELFDYGEEWWYGFTGVT